MYLALASWSQSGFEKWICVAHIRLLIKCGNEKIRVRVRKIECSSTCEKRRLEAGFEGIRKVAVRHLAAIFAVPGHLQLRVAVQPSLGVGSASENGSSGLRTVCKISINVDRFLLDRTARGFMSWCSERVFRQESKMQRSTRQMAFVVIS